MMTCSTCEVPIRETSDPGVPYVHVATGNSFCDVRSTADAVDYSFLNDTGLRSEATPS